MKVALERGEVENSASRNKGDWGRAPFARLVARYFDIMATGCKGLVSKIWIETPEPKGSV